MDYFKQSPSLKKRTTGASWKNGGHCAFASSPWHISTHCLIIQVDELPSEYTIVVVFSFSFVQRWTQDLATIRAKKKGSVLSPPGKE
jgi:uncharacterized protein (UPF0333 family)